MPKMGRPPKAAENVANIRATTLLTPAEYAHLEKQAAATKQSVSAYIRELIEHDMRDA